MMALYGPSEQPITQTMPWRSVMDVYLYPLSLSLSLSLSSLFLFLLSLLALYFYSLSLISLSLSLSLFTSVPLSLLDGHARSSRNDDTQKSFSDSPSLSNSVFFFGGDELLFKWTPRILPPYLDSRDEMAKRASASGDLILIKRRPPPLLQASVLTQRLSYPTETVLFNNITRNRIVLSFKASPRKPLGRRPYGMHTDAGHPWTSFIFFWMTYGKRPPNLGYLDRNRKRNRTP